MYVDDTPTHIDLFSGIGGFALAARWAGIETVAFCEIEPFAQRVLRKNFPGIPIIEDVRNFPTDEFQRPWIITGGYPCQPFSQAGKRRGEEDDRHLWPAMFEIVRSCRPNWVLAENVAGHISMGLDEVLSDLESEDYTVQPIVIPACAVDAPHRRDRVWIVGHSESKHGNECREYSKQSERPISKSGKSGSKNSLAHSISRRCEERESETKSNSRFSSKGQRNGKDVADTDNGRHVWRNRSMGEIKAEHNDRGSKEDGSRQWWLTEPDVGRVADGIPSRVDRLRGLGNAIVPQVAYEIINAMIISNGTERSLPRSRDSAAG
jgi:DNA (cytosine-5)-methyltransferase 1